MRIVPVVLAAVGVLSFVAASSPARADWDDHNGWRWQEGREHARQEHERAWQQHQWREQRWREREWHERAYGAYGPPRVIYSTPPTYYYAPSPPPYYRQGGFAGFGFNVR